MKWNGVTAAKWIWTTVIVAWFLGASVSRSADDLAFLRLQMQRWETAKVRPEWTGRIDAELANFRRNEARYREVEQMRPNGVPALVIFCLHVRESGGSFSCHLHEGSPLSRRTRFVPKGRPVAGDPPFTWKASAEDALYILKSMDRVDWKNPATTLAAIEKFNGLGYYYKGLVSPYNWSGTTAYLRGKFVADHRFDKFAVDKQIGCAAILLRQRMSR